MFASLGCGALSAKCAAGSNILGYFLFSYAETPLLKPLFLVPETCPKMCIFGLFLPIDFSSKVLDPGSWLGVSQDL